MKNAALLLAALAAALPAAAQVNPFPRTYPAPDLSGRWNGVDLELRSNCTQPQNNGNKGTYAQFEVGLDASHGLLITQLGITGLNCEYRGRWDGPEVQGTYSCTDGKQGSFEGFMGPAARSVLQLRLAIKLTGTESCDIDAILGMNRLLP